MRGIIGSSLEKFRESIRPPVIDGEESLARTQASFDGGNLMFASWKPGFLYLTPTRLLFYQGDNRLFEFPLASIRAVEVVGRRWVSKKTCEQLRLRMATAKGARTVHLRLDGLNRWHGMIEGGITMCESMLACRGEEEGAQGDRQEAATRESQPC